MDLWCSLSSCALAAPKSPDLYQMDETLSSFPCPSLFTEGYGRDSDEMRDACSKMQVEIVISEMVRTIELNELGLGLSVRRRLFQQENSFRGVPPSGYPEHNPPPVPRDARCNRCGHDRFVVEARGNGMDFLEYRHMGHSEQGGSELICQSCCYEEGVSCIDCGMSEHFALNQGLPRFMEDLEVWPRNWRCDGCWARRERFEESLDGRLEGPMIDDLRRRDENLTECDNCGRIWDGNAQCPCLLFDEEEEIGTPPAPIDDNILDPAVRALRIRDQVMDQRIVQRLMHLQQHPEMEDFEDDDDGTYIGEYENEEWQPENNTEKVKNIKDSVKNIGEILFDIQEKVTEGEYLKLMDSLQELTNRVNEL